MTLVGLAMLLFIIAVVSSGIYWFVRFWIGFAKGWEDGQKKPKHQGFEVIQMDSTDGKKT